MKREQQQSIGLRTLEDISSIILHSHDLQETLRNIVTIVAKRMRSDVCSIYLLEDDGETLVLKATKGLSQSAVGRISMKTSEGLSGLVVETRGVVTTDNAPSHPRYKYFKESREERYLSFLGLPLFERKNPIGVIVIQNIEARRFSEDEISALRTITFQISSIVMNAKLLDSIQSKEQERAYYEQELARLRTGRPGSGAVREQEKRVILCRLAGQRLLQVSAGARFIFLTVSVTRCSRLPRQVQRKRSCAAYSLPLRR